MTVCFIGHKSIAKTKQLVQSLKNTILALINKGATTFLFGSASEFDCLSWEVVTELKQSYSHIKRIYVRSAYQNIDKSYREYLLKSYEDTYFPIKIENSGKYAYVERNFEMINNSSHCIFYYNPNYVPPNNRKSGTKVAYEYATKKKKIILNLYEQMPYN